jgi:hypothetical protein
MEVLSESNEARMVSEGFCRQVSGYGLTTAHILYRRPDHRWLLQSYVWQDYLPAMDRYDSPTPPERPKGARGGRNWQHNPNSLGATEVPAQLWTVPARPEVTGILLL